MDDMENTNEFVKLAQGGLLRRGMVILKPGGHCECCSMDKAEKTLLERGVRPYVRV